MQPLAIFGFYMHRKEAALWQGYLFHPVRSGVDRVIDSSAWTSFIRATTLKWAGTAVAPKTLRSIFITWLRESTTAPEILKSAAHQMKHQVATQVRVCIR